MRHACTAAPPTLCAQSMARLVALGAEPQLTSAATQIVIDHTHLPILSSIGPIKSIANKVMGPPVPCVVLPLIYFFLAPALACHL